MATARRRETAPPERRIRLEMSEEEAIYVHAMLGYGNSYSAGLREDEAPYLVLDGVLPDGHEDSNVAVAVRQRMARKLNKGKA